LRYSLLWLLESPWSLLNPTFDANLQTTPRSHLLIKRKCLHANATTAARPRSLLLKSTESPVTFPAFSQARSQHIRNATTQSTRNTKKHSTRHPPPRHLPLALRRALPETQRHHDTESKTIKSPSSPPTSEHQGDDTRAPCMTTTRLRNPPLPHSLPTLPMLRLTNTKTKRTNPDLMTSPSNHSQTTPKQCTPSPSTNSTT
jgi:hypothetical protein